MIKSAFVKFANREYEGDVSMKGQTVVVESMPVQSWSAISDLGADIPGTQFTTDDYTVTVSQAYGINKFVRSIEAIRAAFNVKGGLYDAIAQGLTDLQETHFLATLATDAPVANKLHEASAVTLTKDNIIEYIEEMATTLNTNNAPDVRICAIPWSVASLLRQSGIFVYTESGLSALQDMSDAPNYAGFVFVGTTRLPASKIVAFSVDKPHFINQLTEMKVVDSPNRIGYQIVGESYYQAATVGEDAKCIVTLKYA
jgi:hypothetical protein